MATERQIAANRRNAGKSTGPRSRATALPQRSRGNAYQHGLTTGLISSAAFAQKIERLARKIAGIPRMKSFSHTPEALPTRSSIWRG
jgi:hypothetical protein